MNYPRGHARSFGFTIVELLIVVVVIAILATISVVAYNNVTNRAADSAAASAASQAAKKAAAYVVENSGAVPTTLEEAGIVEASGTTYQYTPNTAVSPQLYCITATTGGVSSHIASGGKSTPGPCTGHTGMSPTVAANGVPCPTNYIVVPGSSLFRTEAFCVMKYEAKIQGNDVGSQTYSSSFVPDSRPSGTPWVSISQANAINEARTVCEGCHLITESEWLTIAHNVMSVPSNWTNGTVGTSTGLFKGHSDNGPTNSLAAHANDSEGYEGTGQTAPNNQRRTLTLTNGEIIWDFAGNVHEFTQGTAINLPGLASDTSAGWKAYDNPNLIWNNFSEMARPGYGTPAAATWSPSYNIGQLSTNLANTATRAFARGGNWSAGANAGVLTLSLGFAPTTANNSVGFRVTR